MPKIESNDMPLEKIFGDFYTVPDFQREYVWSEKPVTQLIEDIYEEFYNDLKNSEYFIGSIVVCKNSGMGYDIIDGQQRITTIFLIWCAIRDAISRIEKYGDTRNIEKLIEDYTSDEVGNTVSKKRLILQYEESGDAIELLANRRPKEIVESTNSVKNIKNAYDNILAFLHEKFGNDEREIRKYFFYLMKNVKAIRVETKDVTHALKVFETINDRGVGLSPMDLLKNLMFIKATAEQYKQLKDKWEEITRTLEEINEKPLRFLRYFIMSQYESEITLVDKSKPPREDMIYNWFKNHEEDCGYDKKPLEFVNLLIESAKIYAQYVTGKDMNGNENRYLDNIKHLSGVARQHFILLLAGKHLQKDLFTELCKQIENLFFCYIITREPTKTFEVKFTKWADELRKIKSEEELSEFIEKNIYKEIEDKAVGFEFALQNLNEDDIQQYRIKYILAKLTQFINEEGFGTQPAYAKLENYINKEIDIEHILPETPTAELLAEFDNNKEEYNEYMHRLGNLTLLEKTINASIQRDSYLEKAKAYKKSTFLLVRSIPELVSIGTNTRVERVMTKLRSYEKWDKESIKDRQQLLTVLAKEVWNIKRGQPKD